MSEQINNLLEVIAAMREANEQLHTKIASLNAEKKELLKQMHDMATRPSQPSKYGSGAARPMAQPLPIPPRRSQ
jgi:hypothetical protein